MILFLGSLPKPASVVGESSACSSHTIEKLPDFRCEEKTAINTIPRGSIAVINNTANAVIPTSTPISTKSRHSVHVALLEIEKVIGSKNHLYKNKLIEGYDVPGDSLYIAWKTLYNDWSRSFYCYFLYLLAATKRQTELPELLIPLPKTLFTM